MRSFGPARAPALAAAGAGRAPVAPPAWREAEPAARLERSNLQAAPDGADLDDLRRFTTPELFAELRLQLQERGAAAQHTDVRQVDAEVLGVTDEAERRIVSVRFHGQVVEEAGAAPNDFDEVWHLVKPHDDSRPWAIAGIEQGH